MADIETTITKYRVSYRLHEPNPSRNPDYLDVFLTESRRQYIIAGLEEYTLYDIRLNAIDANNDNLPSYLETRRTSAERKFCVGLSNVGSWWLLMKVLFNFVIRYQFPAICSCCLIIFSSQSHVRKQFQFDSITQ